MFQALKLFVSIYETKCFFKMRKYSANLLKRGVVTYSPENKIQIVIKLMF